jgi:hypothetical protein
VGLLASAHWLAAVGGDGMPEIDANPNPLRSATCGPIESVVDGRTTLVDGPGLGIPGSGIPEALRRRHVIFASAVPAAARIFARPRACELQRMRQNLALDPFTHCSPWRKPAICDTPP